MKEIASIRLKNDREELLPAFSPDFPYIASRAYLDRYEVPWHWHRAAELFYLERGALIYTTPCGETVLPEGAGGLVNAGVLHATRPLEPGAEVVQLLHIFDPDFLSGGADTLIGRRYIAPLTSSAIELLPLLSEDEAGAEVLAMLRASFALSEREFGYELRLRDAPSAIWLRLLALGQPASLPKDDPEEERRVKAMLRFMDERYESDLHVADIAGAAFISERECFRIFRRVLHTTPLAYLRSCRLRAARRMLTESDASVTEIALACGFGSSSAFGKVFRDCMGQTPLAFRRQAAKRRDE